MELLLFEEMSAFELADLEATYQGLTSSTLTIFTSALFAYLVLVYLAASKITKGQLFAISVIYSIFLLLQVAELYEFTIRAIDVQNHMAAVYSDKTGSPEIVAITYPIIGVIGWGLSIAYMLSLVRRK
ncbi:MAG: hypothetical protein AB8B95_11490 [Pseudohongiellaceae bacterium]